MTTIKMHGDVYIRYYSGPERRLAIQSRRRSPDRRYRVRTESLISDYRSGQYRRAEDEDGYVIVPSLYSSKSYPQTRK